MRGSLKKKTLRNVNKALLTFKDSLPSKKKKPTALPCTPTASSISSVSISNITTTLKRISSLNYSNHPTQSHPTRITQNVSQNEKTNLLSSTHPTLSSSSLSLKKRPMSSLKKKVKPIVNDQGSSSIIKDSETNDQLPSSNPPLPTFSHQTSKVLNQPHHTSFSSSSLSCAGTDFILKEHLCTVFVGQFPLSETYKELNEFFTQFGSVQGLYMLKRKVQLKSGQSQEYFKGCVYVEYFTPELAYQVAHQLHQFRYKSNFVLYADHGWNSTSSFFRHLTSPPTPVLFVSNLPLHFSFQEWLVFLQPFKPPYLKVQSVPESGYAFLIYATKVVASQALPFFHGVEYHGRVLRVDFASHKQTALLKKKSKK